MSNWQEITQYFEPRNWRQPRYSNATFPLTSLEKIASEPNCRVITAEKCLILLQNEKAFYRVYYYADDIFAAEAALESLSPKKFGMLILEQISQRMECINSKEESSWKHIRTLRYMVLQRTENAEKMPENVVCADQTDVELIYKLLYELFDPRISHLPEREELSDFLIENNIWVIRREGKVLSFVMEKITGNKTRYIYQVGTAPDARGQKLALTLLQAVLHSAPKGTSYSLWVENENTIAVNLYERLGFVDGGRTLTILIKDKE